MVELTARRHDVGSGLQQPAHDVDLELPRHVEHAIGTEPDDVLDVTGGHDAGGPEPAQLAGIPTRFFRRVHIEPDQRHVRVLDYTAQGACADVPRGPLDHPERAGPVGH